MVFNVCVNDIVQLLLQKKKYWPLMEDKFCLLM